MSKCQKKKQNNCSHSHVIVYNFHFYNISFLCESYFYSAESFLIHFYFFHVSDRTLAVSIDKQS